MDLQARWTMGVDRLPSGSYPARLMVEGQTYTATFPTEDEAREWLVVTRGRVVGVRAARRLTVEAYTRRWLGEFIDTAVDVDRYRRDTAEHIIPNLGRRPLADVTPAEVVALLGRSELKPPQVSRSRSPQLCASCSPTLPMKV